MPLPFANLLKKDDVVLDAETKRLGKVAFTPSERSRRTGVIWQGTKSPQYVDVMQLRLSVDGTPEEVAPVDGEPPEIAAEPPRPEGAPTSPALAALEREKTAIVHRMTSIESEFKGLKGQRERLEHAIRVLKAPAEPSHA